jgi:tetratricopeptide (TPR) repeat protein
VINYRARIARRARDWSAATTLQNARIAWTRAQAAAALAVPAGSLTRLQRSQIRELAVCLEELGHILSDQVDPGCLPYFQEALGLFERIGGRQEEAKLAGSLGTVYLLPGPRDLGQAEHWFQHSLSLRAGSDQLGQAVSLAQLGSVALLRFEDAAAAGEAVPVLVEHLNAALGYYQQALGLTPAADHQQRAAIENQLGRIHTWAGDTGQALRHYQQGLQHTEARGDIYGAGLTRFNIVLPLVRDGRVSDALLYARAALDNFQQAGPAAAADAARAERLIADLEQRSP